MNIVLYGEKNGVQRFAEGCYLFLTGGVLYFGIEVLWRGWSHWSMAVCGGICMLIIYRINESGRHLVFPIRALLGATVITAVEFAAGCIVNLWWGLGVWDYSGMPLQLLGQICLPFTVLWFLLCIPVGGLCLLIRRFVFLRET